MAALVSAVEEGIPDELARGAGRQPLATLTSQLADRLARNHALDPTAARWAVSAWSDALGHSTPPVGDTQSGGGTTGGTARGEVATLRTDGGTQTPPAGRKLNLPLLAGAAAIGTVVLLVAFNLIPGGEPDPSASADASPSTSSDAPDAATQQLLAMIPPFYQPCVRSDDPYPRSIATVECEADRSVGVVYFDLYESRAEMDTDMSDLIDGASVGDCETEDPPRRDDWTIDGGRQGEWLCQLVEGVARVIWSNWETLIIATADGIGGNHGALNDWWMEAPQPR